MTAGAGDDIGHASRGLVKQTCRAQLPKVKVSQSVINFSDRIKAISDDRIVNELRQTPSSDGHTCMLMLIKHVCLMVLDA